MEPENSLLLLWTSINRQIYFMRESSLFYLILSTLVLIQCGLNEPPLIIDKANSPHFLDADLYIPHNQHLIIEAGVELIISDSINIVVDGNLSINGTAEEPTIIKGVTEQPGWGQIQMLKSADNLTITHTTIRDGTIKSYRTKNYLSNVHFINKQDVNWRWALARFELGDLLLENCTALGVNKAEGFLVHIIDNPIVRNCTFTDVPDAVEYINCQDGIISNNTFNGGGDDAIDLNGCIETRIEYNYIDGYNSAGIEIGSEQLGRSINIKTLENKISNCNLGVYLKEASSVEMTRDSFFENNIALDISTPADSLDMSSAIVNQCHFSENQENIKIDNRSLIEINE